MEANISEPHMEDQTDIDVQPAPSSSCINLNDYKGYEPPLGISSDIDRVSASISPQEFFKKYVCARRPVIIEQHFQGDSFKGSQWTNKYLKEKAGDVDVLVEKRSADKNGMFGLSAPKVDMKYREFLEDVEKGGEQYYLTTQDLERFQDDLDDFDMPKSVLAEPLKSLKEDFPVCPELLGKLVPYQVSLWQGHSKEGSSSGLHHDYHDNLYVLIRGQKRFRVFPPSGAGHMSTMGRPIKVHTNGLIVYQSQSVNPTVNVRADGVPLAFLARQKRIEAEQELALAEEEMYSIQDSGKIPESVKSVEIKRLQGIILDCEDRIDLAMEEMLQYGNTFNYDYNSDDDVISVHDDESEVDEDKTDGAEKTSAGTNGSDSKNDEPPPAKIMRLANGSRAVVKNGGDESSDAGKIMKIPDHFCNIVLPSDTDDSEEILSKFSDRESVRCLSAVIKPGEMLYLPASWFHEVTSYSRDCCDGEPDTSDSEGHLALNYWMFPPDGDTFDFPYSDSFWPKRWHSIQEEKSAVFYPLNSGDVITLDTDSEDDASDDDDDDSSDASSNIADAIVVGDDSLMDSSDENEDDDAVLVEDQPLPKTSNDLIEISSSQDVSFGGNFPDNGKLAAIDSDNSVSDGILDSSDEEEPRKAVGDDLKESTKVMEAPEQFVASTTDEPKRPDPPNISEKVENFEVTESTVALESLESVDSDSRSKNIVPEADEHGASVAESLSCVT